MASKKYAKYFFKVIYLHSVHPPFCWGVESRTIPNFQKRGSWQDLRGKLLQKRGYFFEQGEGGIAVFT